MRRAIMILGFLVMSMNLMLWVNGDLVMNNDAILNAYPNLPSGLQDSTDINQSEMALTNSSGDAVSTEGTSSFTTVLDFIESIPVVGSLLTLFRFAFDFIANITFGITFLARDVWHLPIKYVIFIGALNFAIVTFGLLELVLQFTSSRGGST